MSQTTSVRPSMLILRALGLGDLLTAIPALRGLARSFPRHRRVLATTSGVVALAEYAGVVDGVIPVEPLQPVAGAPVPLDVAVNLHGRGPQSHQVLAALAPRRLIGFAISGSAGPEWIAGEHEVQRWCRLLAESGIPCHAGDLDLPPPPQDALVARLLEQAGGVPSADVTLVHPGAASVSRQWPPERWAAVARGEARAGRRVLITGGSAEVSLARRVATEAELPPGAVAAGSTDVLQLAALIAGAQRLVCGDTGVAHLATALRTPSVVLFGPVPPAEWGPPPERPWHVALWAGQRGDPHGRRPDAGLVEIQVDDVLRALTALPSAPERVSATTA